MHCSVNVLNGKMGKCFGYSKKNFLLRTAPGCRVFLKSHRKEGVLLGSFVFITEGAEVLTAERLLSSAFGLTSSLCLDELDRESFHNGSARENITCNTDPFLHFNEKQEGITELSPSHPIAYNRLQQAQPSSAPQGSVHRWASSHWSLSHTNPTTWLGIQIAAASWAPGGAAHVWSSHCVMTLPEVQMQVGEYWHEHCRA